MLTMLSDDAKLMLAFIREHPGAKDFQIIWELHFDIERFQKALKELNENMLIPWQIEVVDDKVAKDEKIVRFRLFQDFNTIGKVQRRARRYSLLF